MICDECETVAHCLKNGCVPKTTKKDEALKLALEALGLNNSEWKSLADSGDAGFWSAEEQSHYKQTEDAITAIKQALLTATPLAAPYVAKQLVQQSRSDVELVGTYGEIHESMQALLRTGLQRDQQIYMAMKDKPLYTTPPAAQRQWVGLTDEEVEDLVEYCDGICWAVAEAIEAKLKEKNCD